MMGNGPSAYVAHNATLHDLDSPDRIIGIRDVLELCESYGYDVALAAALRADTVVIR